MSLLKQGRQFLVVGMIQLLLDWAVFVGATALGVPPTSANLGGRVAGALLGFWLNGRWTFAQEGQARLGWMRLLRFIVVWSALTFISTWLMTSIVHQLGLELAWLAKPLVEGALAVAGFFLWRHLVYR